MSVNPAIANNIALVKKYVDDPESAYGVFRAASLTTDLETPFVQFIGAKTMSYPVFPLENGELEDYDPATGYARDKTTYERREVTVSQDKGYQIPIDALDLIDSHTTAVMHINNKIRQKDVPAIDKYRLKKLFTGGSKHEVEAATADNILALYDAAIADLINHEYPASGLILYVKPETYNLIKNSSQIKRIISVNQKNGDINRDVEYLDSTTKIVVIPSTRWPDATCQFMLVSPLALICGVKRNVNKLVEDPEDFDGILVNRRIVHDCFIQQDRQVGVYVAKTAASKVAA